MIQTVKEYKNAHGLTWLELAKRFKANNWQEAEKWGTKGWLVVTKNGIERLASVKRSRKAED